MAWFKNMIRGIRHDLGERAQDDINALTNLILICLVHEESRQIYRQWVTEQIVNAKEKSGSYLAVGVFSKLVQDASQQERRGLGAEIDEILWKIRQEGQV
jgi:hypothetical protein